MWFIKEIETEMKLGRCDKKLTIDEISDICLKEKIIQFPVFGSDNKFLGIGISDGSCKKLFGLE